MTLSSPNSRIRVFEVKNHKIHMEYTGTEPIETIQKSVILYAEVEYYDMN